MGAYPATTAVPGATGLPGEPGLVLPLGLIEEAVSAAGCREQRRRLLPAAAVMVFVLGLCLFSGEGYGEVARKLAGWLSPLAGRVAWPVPGSSALAKARRRLGPRPFELLFWRLAGPLAGRDAPGAGAFGRLLVAVDGTLLDVPCTPGNIAAFGPPPSGTRAGGFPQVRVVTVAGCGTRGMTGAALAARCGPGTSEQDLARQLARRAAMGRGMLVLADRNFGGYPVVAAVTGTGADVLIRARSSQQLPVTEVLPDGSFLSVLPEPAAGHNAANARYYARRTGRPLPGPPARRPAGITIRVIEADITITPAGRPPRTERYRLITTLLSPAEAPAAQIAALYAQRWEIETGYRELKVFQRGAGRVLRSRDPAGVEQEIWAHLCASQLIHAARADAARAAGDLDPDRISYTITLRAIRRALTTPASPPGAVRAEALARPLKARRHRSYPRLPRAGTAARREARATLTGTITTKITIIPPSPPGLPGP